MKCEHLLADGQVPGWPIVCQVCGESWRRGPRPTRKDLPAARESSSTRSSSPIVSEGMTGPISHPLPPPSPKP